MICDGLAVVLVAGFVGVVTNVIQLYVLGVPTAELNNAATDNAARWVLLIGVGLITVVSGRTPGDMAVMIRWDGGVKPGALRGLLRYLGGVGGWQIGWIFAPADSLFVLVSVIALIAMRSRGGLPGLISGARPVDSRHPKDGPSA